MRERNTARNLNHHLIPITYKPPSNTKAPELQAREELAQTTEDTVSKSRAGNIALIIYEGWFVNVVRLINTELIQPS